MNKSVSDCSISDHRRAIGKEYHHEIKVFKLSMANYYYCRHLAKTSDLFETTTRGLLLNKGLMLSNRAFCCLKIETIMRIIHYTTLREAGIYILATPPPGGREILSKLKNRE